MMTFASTQTSKRFLVVLVKPSHYDEDGYVIQWLRSPIPSNSLASIYGLAQDCAARRVLGCLRFTRCLRPWLATRRKPQRTDNAAKPQTTREAQTTRRSCI